MRRVGSNVGMPHIVEAAADRSYKILKCPPGHNHVEHQNKIGCKNRRSPHKPPFAAGRHAPVDPGGIAAPTAAKHKLSEHHRHTQQQHTRHIKQQKGRSAVLLSLRRKPPHIPQTDCRTDGRGY